MAAQAAQPRAPPGYRALKVDASDVLLELTISNKCGQAFRWRSVQVWEPRLPQSEVKPSAWPQVKKEQDDALIGVMTNAQDAGTTELEEQTEWSLCLYDRVVLLRQDVVRGYIYHRTLLPAPDRAPTSLDAVGAAPDSEAAEETDEWLADYLSLRVPIPDLTHYWSSRDAVFAKQAPRFIGLRMLRQDPWECLCAFICSSNNNISRIGQMVSKLCTAFSPPMLELAYPSPPSPSGHGEDPSQGTASDLNLRLVYHPFPSAARLAEDGVEQKLRDLGFGYRAKFLAVTAQMLCNANTRAESVYPGKLPGALQGYDVLERSRLTMDGISPRTSVPASADEGARPRVKRRRTQPDQVEVSREVDTSRHSVTSYLASLREMPYADARQQLLQFPGIGPKVADCILLMSLDQPSSIPVDRHVFNFAERWYGLRGASARGHKGYEDVANKLREIWGGWAGWAHSVLFTAELRAFAKYEQPSLVKKEESDEGIVETKVEPDPRGRIKASLVHTHSAPAVLTASSARTKGISFSPGVNAGMKGRKQTGLEITQDPLPGVSLAERVKGRRRPQ